MYHPDAAPKRKLLWVGRDGKSIQEAAPADGKRALVGRTDAFDSKNDLWLLDLARGVMTKWTVDGTETGFAAWSGVGVLVMV